MASSSTKPALVFLHGFCENHTLWDHIIPHISYDGPIITPDLPGFGKEPLPFTEFSLEDVTTLLYNSLKEQNITSCICIGHSLGGYITLAFKSKYPDFVTKIGLVHSTAYNDSPEKKEARDKLVEFLDKNHSSKFLSTFAHTLFCDTNKERLKDEINKVVHMSDGLQASTIQAYALAMRDRNNSIHVLSNEQSPLFIAGECDGSVPIDLSKKQISLIRDQSNCYVFENVAHMGMYENTPATIDAINSFLSE